MVSRICSSTMCRRWWKSGRSDLRSSCPAEAGIQSGAVFPGSSAFADDDSRASPMRILAIDTALEACAASVIDTEHGKVAAESLPMERGHAEALMPLLARVMQRAEMPYAALDRIGVTIGPGSFTGLRVGIA